MEGNASQVLTSKTPSLSPEILSHSPVSWTADLVTIWVLNQGMFHQHSIPLLYLPYYKQPVKLDQTNHDVWPQLSDFSEII